MKAYAIVIAGNELSERGYEALVKSSREVGNDFEINVHEAVTPATLDEKMRSYDLVWNWPFGENSFDPSTQMWKCAYDSKFSSERIACAVSHFELWERCAYAEENLLILEHDSVFTRRLDPEPLLNSKYGFIGLNDPRNATRLVDRYLQEVEKNPDEIQSVPTIDDLRIPQGTAGASAYVVKPWAADKIIDAVYELGLWPNDAIVCQQLFDFIGVTKTFYTRVQNLPSTTTK